MFDLLTKFWRRQMARRAFGREVEAMRGHLAALAVEMENKNNAPSSQTVSRETRVNRTGRCLECDIPLKRKPTGRYPLYCTGCRGERSRQQNRNAVARYRAKKARAA